MFSCRLRCVTTKYIEKYPDKPPVKRIYLQNIIDRYNNDKSFINEYKGGRPVTVTTPGK